MELSDLIIPTGEARPGMSLRGVFEECVRRNVPGLPFRDAAGRIAGKASMRHVLKETCIPEFLWRHADLLGDDIPTLKVPEAKVRQILQLPIDPFVLKRAARITSTSPIAKALAVMEDYDTTYIFVVDKDEHYRGVVTIMAVAQCMLDND
jgi:CBS domain-containing protein